MKTFEEQLKQMIETNQCVGNRCSECILTTMSLDKTKYYRKCEGNYCQLRLIVIDHFKLTKSDIVEILL